MRTTPGIEDHLKQLEEVISKELIPTLVKNNISELDRTIFALPARHGGLGIFNPTTTANNEYQ